MTQPTKYSPSVPPPAKRPPRTALSAPDPFDPGDRQRLDKSQRAWTRRFGTRALARLIEIAERLSGRDVALEIASLMYRRQLAHCLDVLTGACTTTMERMMVEPLVLVSLHNPGSFSYSVAGVEDGMCTHPHRDHICIEPQASVGPYRVDFRLEWRTTTFVRRVEETGEIVESWIPIRIGLVIECDSHEHHGRTRLQQEQDARRDREIQGHGDMVVRFTWREIMDDAYHCAQVAIAMLRERAQSPTLHRAA